MVVTLGRLLEQNAAEAPEKAAIIFHDRKLTYRELNDEVNKLAHRMRADGLGTGDRVGLMLTRTPELVISFLAAAKIGGVVVPLNFELSCEGIRAVLEQTTPRIVVVADQFSDQLHRSLPPGSRTAVITTGASTNGWTAWSEALGKNICGNPDTAVDADTVVYLNFTSGSTGNSKGAITTHTHIFWNTVAAVEALGLTPNDVHLCMFAPFAHPHEIFARPLYLGGTMVLIENIYPKSLAKAIEDNRVSCIMGLAPMYENLIEVLGHKAYDVSSLRIPESGGMFTRLDLIERFHRKIGVPIIPVWGSTETTGIALANRPGRDVVPHSAGRPCPHYTVKIVDDEGGELPPGEIGEMIFRGPAVVRQYYSDRDSTDSCFRDGWYFSGDLARMDDQGNFFFVERKRGMMKVAGLKVFPLEIEQVLLDHPAVKEAAVIASRDRLRGEVPKAVVVPKDGATATEKELLQFCRERLAHYKVPRIMEIRQSLPKIGSGKVNKKVLQMEEA